MDAFSSVVMFGTSLNIIVNPAERGKYIFFVEVDLGAETLKRFQEKVLAYKRHWKSASSRRNTDLIIFGC